MTFGFLCYLVYYLVFVGLPNILGANPPRVFHFSGNLSDSSQALNFGEISIVTILIAPPVGLLITALINKRILYKLASTIKISSIVDNFNVWVKALDSPICEWVSVRDQVNGLRYEGVIDLYSDGTGNSELFLKEVEVYSIHEDEYKYSLPRAYFNLGNEIFIVEFRTWMNVPSQDKSKPKISGNSELK